MTRGAKLFLALGGVAGTIGVVLLASRTAKAEVKPALPTEGEAPPESGVVVVPPSGPEEPHPSETPIVVPLPPAADSVDINEIGRLLLRWYAAEGDSLLHSDAVPSADVLAGQGFPLDWGSQTGDLGNVATARHAWMAKAFRFLSGLTDANTLPEASGALDQQLLTALQRWAKSQELPPAQAPTSSSAPAPILITAPSAPAPAPAPDMSATVPLQPILMPQGGPPPFVPPLPAAPAPAPQAPAVPAPAPTLPELPAVLPSAPIAPPAPAAEQPALVPADTARLVGKLLAAEAKGGWKRDKDPDVMAWQKSRGLKQDGRFGPKSALTVAREIGTVPIVRYWPTGSFKEGKWLPEYKAALIELASSATEPRASQLRHSAEREQGQGFGSKQQALPPALLINLTEVV